MMIIIIQSMIRRGRLTRKTLRARIEHINLSSLRCWFGQTILWPCYSVILASVPLPLTPGAVVQVFNLRSRPEIGVFLSLLLPHQWDCCWIRATAASTLCRQGRERAEISCSGCQKRVQFNIQMGHYIVCVFFNDCKCGCSYIAFCSHFFPASSSTDIAVISIIHFPFTSTLVHTVISLKSSGGVW